MKLLAISDAYIPAATMREGLDSLRERGVAVEVRPWEHATLIELQEANLAIENGGPDAITLSDTLLQDIADFDLLVVQFAPVNRQFLKRARSLKVIGVLRGGTENVDVPYATEHNICVINTPGRNARAVAECTLALMLSEVRNIARSHAALTQGSWQRTFPNSDAIPELNQKTVGLIGFGAVGQLVAQYLFAFGCKVVAYDPFFTGDTGAVELIDLPELLQQADVVSLHARLTPESHHLIGRSELMQMKPTAVLVNTARSGLVDEQALAEALAMRAITGAAIDVFDHEPIPADHPFLSLENVTLTPHLAGSTVDAFRGSPALMANHLARLLVGEPSVPIVNDIRPHWVGT